MRTVFNSNAETIHVWAQGEQTYGRAKSGSVFFDDGVLYSYGYHFPVGKFIYNENNDVAVIINTDYYSSTTARHSYLAWGATTHYTQFEKKFTEEKSVIRLLNKLEAKLLKARKPLIYINEANSIITNHLDYLRFIDSQAELSSEVQKAYAPFQIDAEKLKALQDKDRERRKKEVQRKINDFLNYKTDYIFKINDAYIRISKCGNYVETSKGVKVSVREARVLYNKILKGEGIKGFKIDHYTVISLNGTLKIGCHNINLENMHRVGKQLLSMDTAPEKTI